MKLEKFIDREDKRIDGTATEQILTKFKSRFVISDYDPENQSRSRLLHCNLSCETRRIATEDKSAIQIRNREMVDRADLIICYIEHEKGGA